LCEDLAGRTIEPNLNLLPIEIVGVGPYDLAGMTHVHLINREGGRNRWPTHEHLNDIARPAYVLRWDNYSVGSQVEYAET